MTTDDKIAVGKMALAGVLAGLTKLTLSEWVALATLVYVVLQTFVLIRDKVLRRRRPLDKGE